MLEDEFLFTFLEDQELHYFDPQERPKVTKALETLARHIPADVDLPCILIFAPPPAPFVNARVLPFPGNAVGEDYCLMYLAPSVEDMEQEEADFVVAHEFAHASLRHHQNMVVSEEDAQKPYLEIPAEVEADKLAVTWGFTLPPGRRR